MVPGGPQNGPKRTRRGFKNVPKPEVERRTLPRRSHDGLGSPGGVPPVYLPLQGHPFGTRKRTKTEPKTIKNQSEYQEAKRSDLRPSRTRLGAIFVRFEAPCGGQKHKTTNWKTQYLPSTNFFEIKTVQRRSWDQLGPSQGHPKAQKAIQKASQTDPPTTKNDTKSTSILHVQQG